MAPIKKSKNNSFPNMLVEEFIKTLSAKKTDLIFVLSTGNKIIYCTDSAARIIKKKKNELINSKFPFPLGVGKISVSDKNLKVVYGINSISVTLMKKKYQFIFLKKEKLSNKSKSTEKINREDKLSYSRETHGNDDIDKIGLRETILTNPRMLHNIITNFPDQIYVKDLDGKFLLCNEAVVRNANSIKPEIKNEDDLIGKSDFDIFPYENALQYHSYEQAIINSGDQIFNLEETFNGKTSLTSKVLMKDDSGKVIGLIGINRDITERKKVEETLKNERILLRTIIDNLPDAIYTKDNEYRKTLANRADLDNMGCENEAIVLGKTDYDFFPEKTADVFYKDDQLVMESGQPVINREECFVDTKGLVHWLLTSKLPLRDADGRMVGLVGIGHDITKRKRTELLNEALYKISEASYKVSDMYSLYKNIHEAIKTLMPANNFYIAQYDEKTDLLTFPYFIDEHEAPPLPRKASNRMTEYVLNNGEAILVNANKAMELKDSGKIELSRSPYAIWLGVPLKIEGKVIGVIVLRDSDNEKVYSENEKQLLIFVSNQIAQVIERKKNSEAIRQYIEELRLLNQTKDKFFSIIAHDLKNPFITILGFCDLLLSDFADLSEEEKLFYIQEMKQSANLNHNLLQNLLQWSRSQTGRLEYNPCKINLQDLIKEIFLLLRKTSENKEIRLADEIPPALQVTADEDMLNTVLRNLLTNAIKFSNKGSEISVKAVAKDKFVELSVTDSGIGMDQKQIDNLFKLDAMHSTSGTENEQGTGLGLILCKEFIEKSGGKIWVESEVGKGSKFNFTLSY